MAGREQDDLENLVKSPGWLRFCEAQGEEWSHQIDRYIAAAANDNNDVAALNKLRQVIAAKQAVLRALTWPTERLRQLTRPEVPASMSRGGV